MKKIIIISIFLFFIFQNLFALSLPSKFLKKQEFKVLLVEDIETDKNVFEIALSLIVNQLAFKQSIQYKKVKITTYNSDLQRKDYDWILTKEQLLVL
jgi:hypothetical protein